MHARSVLVVDDDPMILRAFGRSLSAGGFDVDTAAGGEPAIEQLGDKTYDVLLLDVSMPDVGGFDVMAHALKQSRTPAIIVVTGEGTVPMAVQAMRAGATDFITKPVDGDALDTAVRRALGDPPDGRSEQEVLRSWRESFAPHVIGEDPRLLDVFNIVQRVADTECSVLVTGPSGTGKELVARAVHNGSKRAPKPFVAVNCAAIPKELMESEIFGHAKGAFTGATEKREGKFEVADGGTLFLDEVGEMDLSLQGKFLRVLQEKELIRVGESRTRKVDVRVVAASNQDLEARCREGLFREDLFYRLNVIPIDLPALCERPGDIAPLADHFVTRAARRHQRRIDGVTDEVRQAFEAYRWPGNVRELENLIERLVILKREDGPLALEDLPPNIAGPSGGTNLDVMSLPPSGIDIRAALEEVEVRLTKEALGRAKGNKAKAAELLGLKRTTLIERLKRLKLE